MSSKTVKTSFENDIRRLKVELESEDAFQNLSDLVRSVYKINPEVDFNMKYLDDEKEEITLSSHGELEEAFRIAEEDGRKVLKLFVHTFDDSFSSTSSFVDVESVDSTEPLLEKKQPSEEVGLEAVPQPTEEVVELVEVEPADETDSVPLVDAVVPVVPTPEPVVHKEPEVVEDALDLFDVMNEPLSVSICETEEKAEENTEEAPEAIEDVIENCTSEVSVADFNAPVLEVKDDMPRLEEAVSEVTEEPQQEDEQPEPEIKWPPRDEIVAQCIAFITDGKMREALRNACALVVRRVEQDASLMDVVMDVFAAFPCIRDHALVQMMYPYLDKLASMAKQIVDWNKEATINYVHLAEKLLANNQFAFQELNLDGVLDLLAQAVRTGAKLELDIFWTPKMEAETPEVHENQEDIKQDAAPAPATEEVQEEKKKCRPVVHKHVQCDMCGVHPIVGVRYKCTKCRNYDLCAACEAKDEHPADHILMKIKVPVAYAGRGRHHARRTKAEFVGDKTLPDNSVVQGDVVMTKTWIVKNTGNHQWANGTHLAFMKGAVVPVNGQDAKLPVPYAAPGETVEVTVNIVTPSEPGKCYGNFRLMNPKGKPFGDRLWMNLVVAEPEPVVDEKKQEVSPPEPEQPKFQYAEELEQIHNMGFNDDELNKYLLMNDKGNVQRVIEWLLRHQHA